MNRTRCCRSIATRNMNCNQQYSVYSVGFSGVFNSTTSMLYRGTCGEAQHNYTEGCAKKLFPRASFAYSTHLYLKRMWPSATVKLEANTTHILVAIISTVLLFYSRGSAYNVISPNSLPQHIIGILMRSVGWVRISRIIILYSALWA